MSRHRLFAAGCKLLAVALLAFTLPCLPLMAQLNATGTVTGTVTDPSGGVIAGATVTITSRATNFSQTVTTNRAGQFAFHGLFPAGYGITVSKIGFQTLSVANTQVSVNKTIALDLRLQVGSQSKTIEVTAANSAALQTLNPTMSSTLNAKTLLELPSLTRDVTSLLNLQPATAPSFHVEGESTAGAVAGSTSDQNTFIVDGGNNTDAYSGNNGYINSFSGTLAGVVPTPTETIQEFTVNTNNMTADFNNSSGGEILAITKRGTNTYHGSAYGYLQNQRLNSNDWSNNRFGIPKSTETNKRFGFDLGGVMLPSFLGGKTYFYFDYEGQRLPQVNSFERAVPSVALRSGIIQVRKNDGSIESFNLGAGKLAVCGPTGTGACDPLGIGMSSAIEQIWTKYMPLPNDPSFGDTLNTQGYIGQISVPEATNFMVGRFDHDFGSNWRLMSSYHWYKDYSPNTSQVDIGGLLPGNTLGKPATASSDITQPRLFVLGLTGTLSPMATNVFHFSYTRNQWAWLRNGTVPQLAGMPGTLEIDPGSTESGNALVPVNVNTQAARTRSWLGHNYDYRDEVSWLHGNHMFQFGADISHNWWNLNRSDNFVGGITNLVYEVDDGSLKMEPTYQPAACGGAITQTCLDPGSSAELSTWNGLYADILGIVNHSSIVATRTGANLTLNPLGTPLEGYVTSDSPDFYFTDTWKALPNLTVNYGLNWGFDTPPHELRGEQDILVGTANQPLTYVNWLQNRIAAQVQGKNYLPTIGFTPIGNIGGKSGPINSFYGAFAPRIGLSWSPSGNGFWGGNRTVFRFGFGIYYSHLLAGDLISNPMLGDGFLEPVSCTGPSTSGACLGQDVATPANAFRIGANGNGLTVPLPSLPQTLASPVFPGITAPYAPLTAFQDPDYRPAANHEFDLSIQRQLAKNTVLEVGYIGSWSTNIFQTTDLNAVPYMMKLGGQTFAQAYLAMYRALAKNQAVGTQPFFETGLAGVNYCFSAAPGPGAVPNSVCAPGTFAADGAAVNNYSQAIAANEGPNILSQNVLNLWSDLDSDWVFGPALYSTNQTATIITEGSFGWSDYNAGVIKLTEHASNGLTLQANLTYAHALGTAGLLQDGIGTPVEPYDMADNWGNQPFDRKLVINVLGTYQLPFGAGSNLTSHNPIISRLISGWRVSPVFTYGSGLPLQLGSGSGQETGAGFYANEASAVPLPGVSTSSLSNSPTTNVVESGNVGANGNPANGGAGVNMFGSNAAAVYNDFRPYLLGLDTRPNSNGQLRGQARWNLDLGLTKDTDITERVHAQIYAQAFNLFNHMEYADPFLSLQDPGDFGVLNSQYNAIGAYTRVIQLGLRVSF